MANLVLHIDSSGTNHYGHAKAYQAILTTASWSVASIWVDIMFVDTAADGRIKIYKDEGGDPDSGTLMGTSENAAITTSPGAEVTFTFSPPVSLDNATSYFIVFEPIAPATAIYFYRTDSSVYADGEIGCYADGIWYENASYDMRQLKIYVLYSILQATIPIIEPFLGGGGLLAPDIPVIEPFLGGGGLLAPTLPSIIPLAEGSDDINHGNIYLTLPSISASITEGLTSTLAVTVPMITATINESVDRGNVSVTLPIIIAEMIGGVGGFLDVDIPLITPKVISGALCEVSIPIVTPALTGVVGELASLNQILPAISPSITGKVEILGDIDTVLPMVQAYMAGLTGKLISGSITLPMITVGMQGYPDLTGDMDAVLSLISVYMVGTIERTTCDVLRFIEPEL